MSFFGLWQTDESGLVRPEPGTPINWDSPTAFGLKYYWPLWEGHGLCADELIHGLDTKANTPATPPLWAPTPTGVMLRRANTVTSVFTASAPFTTFPVTISCLVMAPSFGGDNQFLCHDPGTARGYSLYLNSSGTLFFQLPGVATYSSGITIPANKPTLVAASVTANGGTVIWATYPLQTGLLQTGGPAAIGTISGTPNQWSLGGRSFGFNAAVNAFVADVMVHSRAMTRLELAALVTPDTRWSVFRREGAFAIPSGLTIFESGGVSYGLASSSLNASATANQAGRSIGIAGSTSNALGDSSLFAFADGRAGSISALFASTDSAARSDGLAGSSSASTGAGATSGRSVGIAGLIASLQALASGAARSDGIASTSAQPISAWMTVGFSSGSSVVLAQPVGSAGMQALSEGLARTIAQALAEAGTRGRGGGSSGSTAGFIGVGTASGSSNGVAGVVAALQALANGSGTSAGLAEALAALSAEASTAGASNGFSLVFQAGQEIYFLSGGFSEGRSTTIAQLEALAQFSGQAAGVAGSSANETGQGGASGQGSGQAGATSSGAGAGLFSGQSDGIGQARAAASGTAGSSGLSEGLARLVASLAAEAAISGQSDGISFAFHGGQEFVFYTGGFSTGIAGSSAILQALAGSSGRGLGTSDPRATGQGSGFAQARADGRSDPFCTSNLLVFLSSGMAQGVASGSASPTGASAGSGFSAGFAQALASLLAQARTSGLSEGIASSYIVEVDVAGFLETNGNVIRSRFKALVATPLALPTGYDNAPFDRPDSGPWCRLEVDLGQLSQRTFGAGNTYRKRGEFRAVLNIPAEAGDGSLTEIADAISAAFRNKTISGVNFGVPRMAPVSITGRSSPGIPYQHNGSRWEMTISCPFHDDVFAPLPTPTPGTITGLHSIKEIVRTRFRDLIRIPESLPTAHENAPFTPPDSTPWAMLTVLTGDSDIAEEGAVKTYRTPGVVMVRIYVPAESGDGEARRLADLVVLNFRAVNDRGVRFRVPGVPSPGSAEGPWWAVNVEIPFMADLMAV